MQVAVVIATIGIYNFLQRSGVVDKALTRAREDEDVAKVELPNVEDKMHAEMNTPEL